MNPNNRSLLREQLKGMLKHEPTVLQEPGDVQLFLNRTRSFPPEVTALGWINIADEFGEDAKRFLAESTEHNRAVMFSTAHYPLAENAIVGMQRMDRSFQLIHFDGPVELTVNMLRKNMSRDEINDVLYVVGRESEQHESVEPSHVVSLSELSDALMDR